MQQHNDNRPPPIAKKTTMERFDASDYIWLLQKSPFPIPDIRRSAIVESVRQARDMDELLDIFFDATADSPYLTANQKACLAEQLLSSNEMESLAAAAGCAMKENDVELKTNLFRPDSSFKRMARRIFHKSRKVQSLPLERRRLLGSALAKCQTTEQVIGLVVESLGSALSLDAAARQRVATDILDGRYYRLLLKDRLDCEEPMGRLRARNEEDGFECPICLRDDRPDDGGVVVSCCNQMYCRECLSAWAKQRSDCPTCRQQLCLVEIVRSASDEQPPLGATRSHRWSHSPAESFGDTLFT